MSSRLRVIVERTPEITQAPQNIFISKNEKTGWSINTSIARTCRMSAACAAYCYGMQGRIALPGAVNRQAENTAFFALADIKHIKAEARDLVHVVSRQQRFLRMFGVGDLQPGSVSFINEMAAYAATVKPEFSVWVSTRKYELARKLANRKNLHVMLSFDASTVKARLDKGVALVTTRKPQFFAAWTRQTEDEEIPNWVSVVFEQHAVGTGRATHKPHKKACPATVHKDYGGVSHAAACANCRYCFDTKRRATGKP